jgi:cell wall-associated protease
MKSPFLCVIILSFFAIPAHAQQYDTTRTTPTDWYLKDPASDHLQGISAEKSYATLLAGQPSVPVTVAVVDSGIDIDHEDLKNIIWTNEKEIPGNGIDDDHNGYIDDVHGWNFIGGKDGNVVQDTYELTREYMRLKKKFEDTEESKIHKKQMAEFKKYKKIKEKFEKLKAKNTEQFDLYSNAYKNVKFCYDTLRSAMNTDKITVESLEAFSTSDQVLSSARSFLLNVFKNVGNDTVLDEFISQLKEGKEYFDVIANYGYNENFDSRKIIGDHYENVNEKNYGNNDVMGPDALHGTHVAGIIGADRKNNIGIKGIADNVRIMPIRAVPNGDERDKDIANAIRYAVDNGAKIINMSFGKEFSPEKEAVDKAVKYAEEKGVLLIHAAGNDGRDEDTKPNFPSRFYLNGKEARNWIEVGASSDGADQNLVANFSNYGKKSVDLFAPGIAIYSTTPGNKYQNEDGTSMASPVAAGVAALLMSYFPELTVLQIKDIITRSSRKFDNLKVEEPGTKKKIEFNTLSISGGIINAYEAIQMARNIQIQKTVK